MTTHAELLPRYKRLRKVGMELNNRLVETLPRTALDEGGKNLGLLKGKVLTLDTEDEIAVLMDYCLHDVRSDGANAIERYLATSPPPPNSDERLLLDAAREARFAILAVEAVEPGVGVQVRDLFRDEAHFFVDVGLSQSAQVGLIFVARFMAPEGITMTTGTALPVGVFRSADRSRYLENLQVALHRDDFRNLSPKEASILTARLIRKCLQHGAAERIRYVEPGRAGERVMKSNVPAASRRVGRNDLCPCGSGKKYKRCCCGPR
jgi:SEC-C motif